MERQVSRLTPSRIYRKKKTTFLAWDSSGDYGFFRVEPGCLATFPETQFTNFNMARPISRYAVTN